LTAAIAELLVKDIIKWTA